MDYIHNYCFDNVGTKYFLKIEKSFSFLMFSWWYILLLFKKIHQRSIMYKHMLDLHLKLEEHEQVLQWIRVPFIYMISSLKNVHP